MTIELTVLAAELEAELMQLLTEGMDLDKLWGYQLGYRSALSRKGLLGDIEDEALSRHFESWFFETRRKTSTLVPA